MPAADDDQASSPYLTQMFSTLIDTEKWLELAVVCSFCYIRPAVFCET